MTDDPKELTEEKRKHLSILVVDDLSMMCRVVRRQLKNGGVPNVHEALNVDEALKIIREEEISIIVSDLHIGEETAQELIRKVQSLNKNIPFVVITSDMEESAFSEMKALGVEAYLIKPFTSEELFQQVDQIDKIYSDSLTRIP